MDRDEALDILRLGRAELRRRGVSRAALFGSTARGETTTDSDLDILIEVDPAADLGVFEYVALRRYLADLFPVEVDVANLATLSEAVRTGAERDAIYAF